MERRLTGDCLRRDTLYRDGGRLPLRDKDRFGGSPGFGLAQVQREQLERRQGKVTRRLQQYLRQQDELCREGDGQESEQYMPLPVMEKES